MSIRIGKITSKQLLTGLLISIIFAVILRLVFVHRDPPLVETRRSISVLGTYATMIVIAPEESTGYIMSSMDSLARHLECELGIFNCGELWELNISGGVHIADISPDLRHLLDTSLFIASLTDSLFDPVIGVLVRTWGFPEDPYIPDSAAVDAALASSGLENLMISSDSIHLLSGAQLDFGAIAKGFIVDRIFEHAMELEASAVLVEIGGEIRCGGEPETGRVWRLAVRDPRRETFREIIEMEDGAMATSGDYEVFIMEGGRRLCHIIDPRTGYPQIGVASVTVVGDNCEIADALATAISVGGVSTAAMIPDSLFRMILVTMEDEYGNLTEYRRGEL